MEIENKQEDKKQYLSLCWKCENAGNSKKCEWAKYCCFLRGTKPLTHEQTKKLMPSGVILDNKKNVLFCPKFERDKYFYTTEEKANNLKISIKQYNYRNHKIRKMIFDMFDFSDVKKFEEYFDYEMLEEYFKEIFLEHNKQFEKIVRNNLVTPYNYGKSKELSIIDKIEIKLTMQKFKEELKSKILEDYQNNILNEPNEILENWLKKNNITIKARKRNNIFKN